MSTPPKSIIYLNEYETIFLPRESLSFALGEKIWKMYSSYLQIDFPGIKTSNKWKLKARGWVGQLALSSNTSIAINPKVHIEQFYLMVEYAFDIRLRSFEGLSNCSSVYGFYNFLAQLLVEKINALKHKGVIKSVVQRQKWLPHVRGKILSETWRKKYLFFCQYGDYSATNFDNQVLLVTLKFILEHPQSFLTIQNNARSVFYWLSKLVEGDYLLSPIEVFYVLQSLDRYYYHRLNMHYRSIHALCYFFLSHSTPQQKKGLDAVASFLVNMPYLYEKFVANWISTHLPSKFTSITKEKISFAPFSFVIDLIIYKKQKPLCVIDTKYKNVKKPANSDIFQVVSYAKLAKSSQAVLVYPCRLQSHIDCKVGSVHVRSLSFVLGGDIEQIGKEFLETLFRKKK